MKRAFYPKRKNVEKWIEELKASKTMYDKMNRDTTQIENQIQEYIDLLNEYDRDGIEF